VVPVSFTSIKRHYGGYTVPCCKDCNVTLGSKLFCTIPERARYLAFRLPERFKRLLAIKPGSEEDEDDLSPEMRQVVRARENKKAEVVERIMHCLRVASSEDVPEEDE
jgi:hypothetical protein